MFCLLIMHISKPLTRLACRARVIAKNPVEDHNCFTNLEEVQVPNSKNTVKDIAMSVPAPTLLSAPYCLGRI